MPKLFDSLFGQPSKKFSSSKTPTGFESLPGFGQDAFRQALQRGTDLSQQEGLFGPSGLTPEQLSSLQVLSGGLNTITPEQFQSGVSTFNNPFEEQVVQNSLRDIRETGQGLFSDISTAASNAGGFGGDRQALLEAKLQENILRTSGEVGAQTRSAGFQKAADRAISDIGRTQDVAGNLFNLADLQRQISTQQRQSPIQAINFLQSLAKGIPVGGGNVTSGTTTGDRMGLFEQAGDIGKGLGGLAGGAASLAALFSDSRLKKNIKFKRNEKGHRIYEFEYKWGAQKYEGVMAQDVLEIEPDAVIMKDGFYMVDYNKIGLEMRVA